MNLPELQGVSLFAEPGIEVDQRPDGALILENPLKLEPYAHCVGEYLEHWGKHEAERQFLLERGADDQWQGVTYGQALTKVRQIGGWLLANHKRREQPVCVLSDNSVEHGLLMLACLHVGIPYAAISPAYSLVSSDHAKLKNLIERLDPEFIYVNGVERFHPALKSIEGLHHAGLIVADQDQAPAGALRFSEIFGQDGPQVEEAYQKVGPDTVAKILFTSGSTGYPKGVINTQRMLCASQQAKRQVWPFLAEHPPVLLDWLPWNHTFGGNHNFNLVLANGGTLYIDSGKPLPGLFDQTVKNLRDVSPTLYLNVPRAFDMLLPALRTDDELRSKFFSRLKIIFYAAAALPQHLWDGLIELSKQELGHSIPMVTSWGSTETAPLATDCYYQADRSGVIGLPVPGVSIKLVPSGDKLEVRVKGPNVTPGYYRQPDETAKSFDEEGYYRIGDAAKFADPDNPRGGLMFDGRVSEDFKLTTATWVSVGALRVKGIETLAPVVQDIVVTGHDRDSVGFMIFPNVAACRRLAGLADDVPVEQVVEHKAILEHVNKGLQALRAVATGSSTFADRAVMLTTPPSVDSGEITDKGYINQSAVLRTRAALVEKLYGTEADPFIIRL